MTIGSAIFFSSLIISLAILYAATKNQWNWGKLTKKILLIPFVLLLCVGFFIWVYLKIEDMPTKQIEFLNVKLGDSKEDVLFKKGNPPENSFFNYVIDFISQSGGVEKTKLTIKEKDNKKTLYIGDKEIEFGINSKTGKLYSESEIRGLLSDIYNNSDNILNYGDDSFTLKNNKVVSIKKNCSKDKFNDFQVNRIGCSSKLGRIEKRLGKAKKIKCSGDSLVRVYYFPKYQSAYKLNKDGVRAVTVYSKDDGDSLDKHLKECGAN